MKPSVLHSRLVKAEVLASLPPEWPEDLLPQIRAALTSDSRKLVVLDDDPTGTQTVQGVPVLTTWDVKALRGEFADPCPCFFLLTNSRSLLPDAAGKLMRGIARNLAQAADRTRFTVVSRSDSTLRGHYPLETDVLTEELGPFDATILIPYFEAGGRFTIQDVHYVAEGGVLVPAAETPFAQDPCFGYRASNLRDYVEEKTRGRVKANEVVSISLDELRRGGPGGVTNSLLKMAANAVGIVNAAAPRDLEVFVAGLLMAEAQGKRFLFRTAAQFVSTRLGMKPSSPLAGRGNATASHPATASAGGLVVVGSHVPKSTEQLRHLLASTDIAAVELAVESVLDESSAAAAIVSAAGRVDALLRSGQNVALFTSRQLLTGNTAAETLRIHQRVSAALVSIVSRLVTPPRFLIAKGGITSSDLATRALGVCRATVRGQVLPGIPVWELGAESRFPGLEYVVFPGNVGELDALTQVVKLQN